MTRIVSFGDGMKVNLVQRSIAHGLNGVFLERRYVE